MPSNDTYQGVKEQAQALAVKKAVAIKALEHAKREMTVATKVLNEFSINTLEEAKNHLDQLKCTLIDTENTLVSCLELCAELSQELGDD